MWEAIQVYAGWYVASRTDAVCDVNGGLLAFNLEQNALLIAAALNADEQGEILRVRPSEIPVEKDHGIMFPDADGQGATVQYKDGTSQRYYNAKMWEPKHFGEIRFPV